MKTSPGAKNHCVENVQKLDDRALKALKNDLSDWQILEHDQVLEKLYKFADFSKALEFVNQIGSIAEKENHHPDIFLSWGRVSIKWSTHSARGITQNDVIMAAKCDEIYENHFS
ncbi:MAG: 4a-hydroxytetrahydrobiopterin dehydratase [Bdellovibrionales bacterium]|nr:4a-hydroxytetrahydrobiopterin dehydratase [Bdellovibrionales bacterium]